MKINEAFPNDAKDQYANHLQVHFSILYEFILKISKINFSLKIPSQFLTFIFICKQLIQA